MNLNNIAIVRATNIIPFDGKVKSIANSMYLIKNTNLAFSKKIKSLLKNAGIIPPMDFTKTDEQYFIEYSNLVNEITKSYLPYVSDYNSLVLFSLNGIVPDDYENGFGNNTFSNKKCAIIDSLGSHINEVVSLMPTDTAIKGDVLLSKDAVILIEEETYSQLTDSQKEQLSTLDLQVKIFKGNLKDAIYQELVDSKRYVPETLSLSRKDKGFKESPTRDAQIQAIDDIASYYEIPQVLFFNILTGQNDYPNKLVEYQKEVLYINLVVDYYLECFYQYILDMMNAPESLKAMVPDYMNYNDFLDELLNLIESFGIENYQKLVIKYNNDLESKRLSGNLPTPRQIIENNKTLNK